MIDIETVPLSHLNSSFILEGSKDRRSIEILKVMVKEGNPEDLNLVVLDEKDVPIYNQALKPDNEEEMNEVTINKKFVFYDHLSVSITAIDPDTSFAATIVFK